MIFKTQEHSMQIDIPLKIAGIGRYLPEHIVKNPELEALCGLSEGWIEERNGVRERRWVTSETNSYMGAQAAKEALEDAGITLDEIDLILNASGTSEQAIPDTSALMQRELGMGKSGIACMTVHTTCLSFVVALDTCASLLASGRYKNILVITADIASVGINPKEPESATLVGDAAAAVVVTLAREGEPCKLHHALLRTYGDGAYYTAIMGGGARLHPNKPGAKPEDNLFHMDGLSALRMVNRYIYTFLDELYPGLSKSSCDLDAIVPHQASKLGLMLLTRFGWPEGKILRTLEWMGNCVAASIPSTLYEGIRSGRIQRGNKVLLIGTSAGLSIGAVILTY
jgi:3-oxoacyl-[acyl-carrier-protein] synthase III